MTGNYRITDNVLRTKLLEAIFEDCDPSLPGVNRYSKGLLVEQFVGAVLRVRYPSSEILGQYALFVDFNNDGSVVSTGSIVDFLVDRMTGYEVKCYLNGKASMKPRMQQLRQQIDLNKHAWSKNRVLEGRPNIEVILMEGDPCAVACEVGVGCQVVDNIVKETGNHQSILEALTSLIRKNNLSNDQMERNAAYLYNVNLNACADTSNSDFEEQLNYLCDHWLNLSGFEARGMFKRPYRAQVPAFKCLIHDEDGDIESALIQCYERGLSQSKRHYLESWWKRTGCSRSLMVAPYDIDCLKQICERMRQERSMWLHAERNHV